MTTYRTINERVEQKPYCENNNKYRSLLLYLLHILIMKALVGNKDLIVSLYAEHVFKSQQ